MVGYDVIKCREKSNGGGGSRGNEKLERFRGRKRPAGGSL